jgi:cytoplasmic iron level regulating protein YaaA (DUF328/UPF0246 family)
MAYIISCSGRKTSPLQHPNSQASTIEKLSFNEELLIWRTQNVENHNLNWDYCLPAWQLYTGKLYSQVQQNNWIKPDTSILIVSALFGIIKHTDLIPTYNLVMDINLANFWRNSVDLNKFINHIEDIDLLSKNYRKAFNHQGNPIVDVPNVIFTDRYGHHKGIWLNDQLRKH